LLCQQTMDEFPPRRPNTDLLIKQWLKQRHELLMVYNQLCDKKGHKLETIQQFCQILMDYLSLGHFKMFETLAEAHPVFESNTQGLNSTLLKKISKTTDIALDFNDKYTEDQHLGELAMDLSLLGENLAYRMDWEDTLIKAYLRFASKLH